jgi:hypothetical protein
LPFLQFYFLDAQALADQKQKLQLLMPLHQLLHQLLLLLMPLHQLLLQLTLLHKLLLMPLHKLLLLQLTLLHKLLLLLKRQQLSNFTLQKKAGKNICLLFFVSLIFYLFLKLSKHK